MEMLANNKIIIILQNIIASNQHAEHLKLTQCCLSIISQKGWKKYINKQTQYLFLVFFLGLTCMYQVESYIIADIFIILTHEQFRFISFIPLFQSTVVLHKIGLLQTTVVPAHTPSPFPLHRDNHFHLFQLIIWVFTFMSLSNRSVSLLLGFFQLNIFYELFTQKDEILILSSPSPTTRRPSFHSLPSQKGCVIMLMSSIFGVMFL